MKNIIFIGLITLFTSQISAQQKDTLFFNSNDYLEKEKGFPDFYFLKYDIKNGEEFLFKQDTIYKNLKPKKVICLKNYIENTEFYDDSKNYKINAHGLYEHLRKYTIFLVIKENNETNYIQVFPLTMIE